jgi:alkylation response protein AidB-like acyl-CoA dehydrogenase
VSTAKVVAGEAAIANGKTATQVFGGMGYTWEVDVHLYLKRAWVLNTVFGTPAAHADALAAALA